MNGKGKRVSDTEETVETATVHRAAQHKQYSTAQLLALRDGVFTGSQPSFQRR